MVNNIIGQTAVNLKSPSYHLYNRNGFFYLAEIIIRVLSLELAFVTNYLQEHTLKISEEQIMYIWRLSHCHRFYQWDTLLLLLAFSWSKHLITTDTLSCARDGKMLPHYLTTPGSMLVEDGSSSHLQWPLGTGFALQKHTGHYFGKRRPDISQGSF